MSIHTLPGAMWSVAHLINDAGMIAGTFHDGTDDHLFVYTDSAGMVALPDPVEHFNPLSPRDLNQHGQLVGVGLIENMYAAIAWFWSQESGMRVLDDLVVAGPDISIIGVGGINDAGQIAVTATLGDTLTQRAVRLDPVAPADIDANGEVNVDDLIAVILTWGSDDPVADIDGDGVVEVDDLIAVILAWG